MDNFYTLTNMMPFAAHNVIVGLNPSATIQIVNFAQADLKRRILGFMKKQTLVLIKNGCS